MREVRERVIGYNSTLPTPDNGSVPLVYADHAGSGRSMDIIEDTIQRYIAPMAGNPHSDSAYTARQITQYREESRETIKKILGNPSNCSVIFAGNGVTGAINKLVAILGTRIGYRCGDKDFIVKSNDRPIVLIGPYEHHSNILPWQETIADVVIIKKSESGQIDPVDLRAKCSKYSSRKLKIGSFSAGSNVTGVFTNITHIAQVLRDFGFLSFWDHGSSGPHQKVSFTPIMDALFLSPHKYAGGPGSSGILVVRNSIFADTTMGRPPVPSQPGGGTVRYVGRNPGDHAYEPIHHTREEGGSPNFLADIRAGMVLALHDSTPIDWIKGIEGMYVSQAILSWGQPQIVVYGTSEAERAPTIAFNFRHGIGSFLHYNFVAAVLSDYFGIQVRAGCLCAAPYGHELLNISREESSTVKQLVVDDGTVGAKPGYLRASFAYYMSPEEVGYIISAVQFLARNAGGLLLAYEFFPTTGVWRVRRHAGRDLRTDPPATMKLHQLPFSSVLENKKARHEAEKAEAAAAIKRLAAQAAEAKRLAAQAEKAGAASAGKQRATVTPMGSVLEAEEGEETEPSCDPEGSQSSCPSSSHRSTSLLSTFSSPYSTAIGTETIESSLFSTHRQVNLDNSCLGDIQHLADQPPFVGKIEYNDKGEIDYEFYLVKGIDLVNAHTAEIKRLVEEARVRGDPLGYSYVPPSKEYMGGMTGFTLPAFCLRQEDGSLRSRVGTPASMNTSHDQITHAARAPNSTNLAATSTGGFGSTNGLPSREIRRSILQPKDKSSRWKKFVGT
ncbi:Cysteine desulfurase SufS [Vanrija pseudolonga]|uniref:Cysteine desulfurase SufS n=1 Tax=Vanrija pseudolonga TaxID=143232 RepID=A0AAF0YAM2_9TREE|nr:Cysteine desulfurase SufS [Vanrija pseudolonga]